MKILAAIVLFMVMSALFAVATYYQGDSWKGNFLTLAQVWTLILICMILAVLFIGSVIILIGLI